MMHLQLSAQSCLGYWITIDDESGLKKSIVELYKKDGKMYGKVVYIYKRGKDGPHSLCDECEGYLKNKPVMGMQIVKDLNQQGIQTKKQKSFCKQGIYKILHNRAYIGEITARTEQYFCPIKHARKALGTHARYAHFLDYGEADDYQAKLEAFRAALGREESPPPRQSRASR
jgi:hypothetical protein